MYSIRESLILGFHGCDESVKQKALASQEHLKASQNDYDWLGHGVYFWECDPKRALEFAKDRSAREGSKITKPAVIGAVIHLGSCLNLSNRDDIQLVKSSYDLYADAMRQTKTALPENKNIKGRKDFALRKLDCAVINYLHYLRKIGSRPEFDSVIAAFPEGSPIFKNSGFQDFSHIQICVRNLNCIRAYFDPLVDPDGVLKIQNRT